MTLGLVQITSQPIDGLIAISGCAFALMFLLAGLMRIAGLVASLKFPVHRRRMGQDLQDGYDHFDRTGVKKIKSSLPQPYSERVALPLYFRVIVANLFALVGSLALLPAISISLDPAAYVYVLAYLLLAGLMFVIVTFTMGIKIRVRHMRALGGEELDMLQIRGNRKELVYIPCKDITDIRQVEYQSSGWRTFLLGEAKTDKDQGHKMIQTDYCGPGLSVTYTSNPFFGSVGKTATQQFPSRRAGELAQRLRHHFND